MSAEETVNLAATLAKAMETRRLDFVASSDSSDSEWEDD